MKKKKCSRCDETKELSEFYIKKVHTDGRRSECIVCAKKYEQEYRKRDVVKLRKQEYWIQNLEHLKAKAKVHARKYPELKKVSRKKWADYNKGKIAKYRKEYDKRNRKKVKKRAHKKYLRKKERLWQLKPRTKAEWLKMFQLLQGNLLRAIQQNNRKVLYLLKEKFEQLANMDN